MFEDFFVLNARGDLLLAKAYLGVCDEDMYEAAFEAIDREAKRPPFFFLGLYDKFFVYRRHESNYLCLSLRAEGDRQRGLNLLSQMLDIFLQFIQISDENTILSNRILLYEILDEVLYLGEPFNLSASSLRSSFVLSRPKAEEVPLSPYATVARVFQQETTAATPSSSFEVTVKDCLSQSYTVLGKLLHSSIDGCLLFSSQNIHLQEATIALHWASQSILKKTTDSSLFETCLSHDQVSIPYFDRHRAIKFKVAEDTCRLMCFRSEEDVKSPIAITTSIKRYSDSPNKMDLFVILKCNFSHTLAATEVILSIILPINTILAKCQIFTIPSAAAHFSFDNRSKRITHSLGSLNGGEDFHVRYKIRLDDGQNSAVAPFGPLHASYEIVSLNLSNLKVTSMTLSSDGIGSLGQDDPFSENQRVKRTAKYTTIVSNTYELF